MNSRLKILLASTLLIVGLAGSASVFAYSFEIPLPSIPGTTPGATPGDWVRYVFILSLGIGGILAFAMIVIGGAQLILAGGNVGSVEDARGRIRDAILGLMLLLFAYLILYTINPNLVGLNNPGLTPPAPPGPGPASSTCDTITASMCSTPSTLAAACNTAFPFREAPSTTALGTCILTHFARPIADGGFGAPFIGSIFSYDVSNPLCNYTRGRTVCSPCSHALNSCHYGGSPSNPNGNLGALAIDFGLAMYASGPVPRGSAGSVLVQAALTCGGARPRCELGGLTHDCATADHVHVSDALCNTY